MEEQRWQQGLHVARHGREMELAAMCWHELIMLAAQPGDIEARSVQLRRVWSGVWGFERWGYLHKLVTVVPRCGYS